MIFEENEIDLSSINFNERHEFYNCIFQKQDLKDLKLISSLFDECSFINCDLSNATFMHSKVQDTSFIECKILGINWSSLSGFMDNRYSKCILNYSSFTGFILKGTKFEECSLHDCDFSDSDASSCSFQKSDLAGANFNNANLKQADFRYAQNYLINPLYTQLQKARFSTPEVLTLLSPLGVLLD